MAGKDLVTSAASINAMGLSVEIVSRVSRKASLWRSAGLQLEDEAEWTELLAEHLAHRMPQAVHQVHERLYQSLLDGALQHLRGSSSSVRPPTVGDGRDADYICACPFCRAESGLGHAYGQSPSGDHYCVISCSSCHASGPIAWQRGVSHDAGGAAEDRALALWNKSAVAAGGAS